MTPHSKLQYEILANFLVRGILSKFVQVFAPALEALKVSGGAVSVSCADFSVAGGDLSRERASAALEVVVERLVQRLVCGAATLDPRFSSKFLATLDGIRGRSKVSRGLHQDALPPKHSHSYTHAIWRRK
jgi:hypothetical protein